MFFVIGAPTYKTVDKFKEQQSMYGDQLRLVICASLEGYMGKLTNNGAQPQNVYDLPTNFRAHFSDFTQMIQQGQSVH